MSDNKAPLPCQVDPELFFPITYEGPSALAQITQAKAVCRDCDDKVPCEERALRTPGMDGIWGGTTPEERRARASACAR
jgi:WhiB family redox-sensing transcriptional regulator